MDGVPEMVREMGGEEHSVNVIEFSLIEESEAAFTSKTEPFPERRVMEEKTTLFSFSEETVWKWFDVVEMERREEEVSVSCVKVTVFNTREPEDASMSVLERLPNPDPLKRRREIVSEEDELSDLRVSKGDGVELIIL